MVDSEVGLGGWEGDSRNVVVVHFSTSGMRMCCTFILCLYSPVQQNTKCNNRKGGLWCTEHCANSHQFSQSRENTIVMQPDNPSQPYFSMLKQLLEPKHLHNQSTSPPNKQFCSTQEFHFHKAFTPVRI